MAIMVISFRGGDASKPDPMNTAWRHSSSAGRCPACANCGASSLARTATCTSSTATRTTASSFSSLPRPPAGR